MKTSVKISNPSVCNDDQASSRFDESMKLVGDFWLLQVVDSLATGPLRFCEIERALPQINPVTLTNRLKKMEESKLVNRITEIQDKQSVSYALTDKGLAVLPIIESIKKLSD